ncbi:MAG: hypothetical protein LDLANPLL_02493 [Turneriella sp.]|nr:hypothetical protein [Turneriella sp.]
MKKIYLTIFVIAFLVSCKKSSVFTEINASFKSLDDVFVEEFKNEKRNVEKNTEANFGAHEAKTGRYGTLVVLDVWEFASESESKQHYEALTNEEKNNTPREYDQTKSNEYRYQFIRGSGVAGEIFTIKKLLFRILGENKDTIREYLIASKLANIR